MTGVYVHSSSCSATEVVAAVEVMAANARSNGLMLGEQR